jgi:hypothetical protein
LEQSVRAHSTPQQLVMRARLILQAEPKDIDIIPIPAALVQLGVACLRTRSPGHDQAEIVGRMVNESGRRLLLAAADERFD